MGIGLVFIGLAVILLVVALEPAWFGVGPPYRVYPLGGFFLVFLLLLVGFFVVRVAFWTARSARHRGRYGGRYGPVPMRERPAMVARMRYARGEITRKQYEEIMNGLRRPPGPM
jgi:uncharacterized membrane protein